MRAVYPGSFDPFTKAHLSIVRRAASIANELTVLVLRNTNKTPLLSLEERKALIQEVLWEEGLLNVRVESYDGSLVSYIKRNDIKVLIRGLRDVMDFTYEQRFFDALKSLLPDLEVIYLFSLPQYRYMSSSLAKEMAAFSLPLRGILPSKVAEATEGLVNSLKGEN